MNIKPASQFTWVGWLFLWPVILWIAAWLAQSYVPDQSILAIANQMAIRPKPLLPLHWTDQTLRFLLLSTLAYALGIGIYFSSRRNLRPKEEHGSAQWAVAAAICRRYRDPIFAQNILLTENFRMGFNSRKHRRNLNVLVVGGSGAGKTRFYAKPNLMQANCSFLVTDPKGELLRDTGQLLKAKGYEVKVFDLINMSQSFCYNPFQYIRDDKDVLKLVTNLIRNTTPNVSAEPRCHSVAVLICQ